MALLDAEFVRELERLKRRLDTDARSGEIGQGAAPRQGSATEFSQHRHYAPGDDLRRIDWLAFARSGQPVVKQYQAEEDAVGRILIDHSASLGFGSPAKLDAAKRIAGAFSYLWLSRGLRCQLVGVEEATTPMHAGPVSTVSHTRFFAARRGRPLLARALREIESLRAAGPTQLIQWVNQIVNQSLRPGILVVLSDFLDPKSPLVALDRARARGHDVVLVQVLSPEELAPDLEGDLELTDSETGRTLTVSIDSDSLQAYHRRLASLCKGLEGWAKKRRQTYVRASSAEPLAPVMLSLLRGKPRATEDP